MVELARRDVAITNELLASLSDEIEDLNLYRVLSQIVGSQILLLRAIEEVEARPWWKRRRFNLYVR